MADQNLDWMRELPERELKRMLDRDAKMVFEYCGLEVLMELLRHLPSIQLYISTAPLERAKALYILENFEGNNHKQLAAKLRCSLKYVYQVLKAEQEKELAPPQPELFES
jgi:Mor family transcriptional regulator